MSSKAERDAKRNYLRSYKEYRGCHDCKQKFPHYQLQYDHKRAKEKNLADMVSSSWKALYAEMDKCDVVCSNCHSARTWWRLQAEIAETLDELLDVVEKET